MLNISTNGVLDLSDESRLENLVHGDIILSDSLSRCQMQNASMHTSFKHAAPGPQRFISVIEVQVVNDVMWGIEFWGISSTPCSKVFEGFLCPQSETRWTIKPRPCTPLSAKPRRMT